MLFQNVMVNINKDRQTKNKKWNLKNIERKCSLKLLFSLLSPTSKERRSEKASFCFSFFKKGSMAVEAALVLPLFFFGITAMISFMDLYRLETEHLTKLCEKTKEAGMYAYALDGSGVEEITLPDVYSFKPVSGMLPLPKVWRSNTVKVHAWTGGTLKRGAENADGTESEKMVYVTETGTVYHQNDHCTYIKLSIKQVSGAHVSEMSNVSGDKYKACEHCSRNKSPAAVVTITDQGNRYHNQSTCSGLKRTVRLVKESQVCTDHRLCSRCG